MEALEIIRHSNNWITLLLLLMFVVIFVLKTINAAKLKGRLLSFLNVSYIETEIDENAGFFNWFQMLSYLFSILTITLLIFKLKNYFYKIAENDFSVFITIFISLFGYFVLKKGLEYLFSVILLIKKEVVFFRMSKANYLNATSFFVYICLIFNEYTNLSAKFLCYFSIVIFILSFGFHVLNNKKLIFSKLFYFILYICAFEIAPLFLLFKLMF